MSSKSSRKESKKGSRNHSRSSSKNSKKVRFISSAVKVQCPKCNRIPYIQILEASPLKVSLQCYSCDFSRTCLFEELLSQKEPKETFSDYCDIHRDQKNAFYCLDCQCHFCSNCQDWHSSHQFKKLKDIVQIEPLRKKLDDIQEYFGKTLKDIQSNLIKGLQEKTKKLEELFNANFKTNESLIKFAGALIGNYNESNYYSIVNIANYAELTLNKLNTKSKIKDVIDYYENNYILALNEKPKIEYKKEQFIKTCNLTKIKEAKKITEEKDEILGICLLRDGRLASCSTNSVISIYNTKTYECDFQIKEHTNGVNYLSLTSKGYLLSCSGDTTIKMWEILKDKYILVNTYSGHTGWVSMVIQLKNGNLLSSSFDRTLRIWNVSAPFECIKSIRNGIDYVVSMLEVKKGKYIASCTKSASCLIYNEENSFLLEKTIDDVHCSSCNSIIQLKNKNLLVGGLKSLTMINLNNFRIERKIKDNSLGGIFCIYQCRDETIIFGDSKGQMCHLSISESKVLEARGDCHEDGMTGILFLGNEYMITSSKDGSVKVWNY